MSVEYQGIQNSQFLIRQSSRGSNSPPKVGSSRVKSPLPAPAAYRASCMSAAAKRYKVRSSLVWEKNIDRFSAVFKEDFSLSTHGF